MREKSTEIPFTPLHPVVEEENIEQEMMDQAISNGFDIPMDVINNDMMASERLYNCDTLELEATELVIFSQDVAKLYPSLDLDMTVQIVGEAMEDTEIKFEEIDYEEIGKYLAINMTDDDIRRNKIRTVVPIRKKERDGPVRGPRPTMAYLSTDKDQNGEQKWLWKSRTPPSPRQKKVMLARTIEIAVKFACI